MKAQALLFAAAAVALPLLGQQLDTTPYFAIHLVVDCGSAEKIVVKSRDDKHYCIEPAAVVTDRDVSSAKSTSDIWPSLDVTLGAAGSERLYKATAERWIKGEGSLALLINGEVVGVSRIYEPLRDDVALPVGTKEEVSLWAGVLQSRASPSLQAREVIACPPGGHATTVEGTSEKFCLAHSPLLDERDVSVAEIAKMDQGRRGLTVQIKTSSIAKVRESTEALVGGKVGFVVNNRLIMVASVKSPFGGSVTVYGNFSADELHSLVDGLSAETHSQP
jgi:hypothetical protein